MRDICGKACATKFWRCPWTVHEFRQWGCNWIPWKKVTSSILGKSSVYVWIKQRTDIKKFQKRFFLNQQTVFHNLTHTDEAFLSIIKMSVYAPPFPWKKHKEKSTCNQQISEFLSLRWSTKYKLKLWMIDTYKYNKILFQNIIFFT